MSLRSGSALLIVAFVLLISASARAEMFTAYLTPAQEVPPTASTARGFARVLVNETTGQITFTVVFEGLSSTQTLAHIHAPAAIGASASPVINFPVVGGTSGTITGTAAITPTQISQLRQHLGYVNVHSTNFPNGEIRGQLGAARPVDYDGDGRTDPSVLRFPNIDPPDVAPITWWNLNSYTGPQSVGPFGDANADFPAPGDYDGDGRTDFAGIKAVNGRMIWRYRKSSTGEEKEVDFGLATDVAVPGDYDGDGTTDFAIFRRSDQSWWIYNSGSGAVHTFIYGQATDIPLAAHVIPFDPVRQPVK